MTEVLLRSAVPAAWYQVGSGGGRSGRGQEKSAAWSKTKRRFLPSTDTLRRPPKGRNEPSTPNIPPQGAEVKTRFTISGLSTGPKTAHRGADSGRGPAGEARQKAGALQRGAQPLGTSPALPGAPSGGGGAWGRRGEPRPHRSTTGEAQQAPLGRGAQPKGPGPRRARTSGPQGRAGGRGRKREGERSERYPRARRAAQRPRRSRSKGDRPGSPQRSEGKAGAAAAASATERDSAHTGRAAERGVASARARAARPDAGERSAAARQHAEWAKRRPEGASAANRSGSGGRAQRAPRRARSGAPNGPLH